MEKSELIALRVSPEYKAALQDSAAQMGESLTTFIEKAINSRIQVIKRRPPKREPTRGVHEGVPSFFRGCCLEAQRGGENGYANAAWHLSGALGSQIPYDIEDDDWADQIDALKGLIKDEDGEGVWSWFKRHYPKCMQLVPTRRREQFVSGVYRAYQDGRIEL